MSNEIYKHLKEKFCCDREGYEGHDTIKDMWKYRNSREGALDFVHYSDQIQDKKIQGGQSQDNENNSYSLDVDLDEPELTPEAKKVMGTVDNFSKFIGENVAEDLDENSIEEEYFSNEISENISQFDMLLDSLFISIEESYESKPNVWRNTKRIADRIDADDFAKIVERKVKDDTMAEVFVSIHRILTQNDYET